MIFVSKTPTNVTPLPSYPAFYRQEQALRDVKAAAEVAQQVLAEDAKRSAEALKAKCSLVQHHDTPFQLSTKLRIS